MKALCFILTIFLLINILVGCEEIDPITPDPILPTIVSGNINVFPTSITAGETVTISWSDLVNVKTLMINNTPISISDGSKIYTLTTTTTFSINLIGTNDKVIEKSAVVNVVEPPVPTKRDTIINLLSYGSFKRVKNEWKINGVWNEMTISDMESRRLLSFTKDGKMKDYDPLGIGLTFDGNYQISTDLTFLIYGTMEYEFVILNDKQMIVTYWSQMIDPVTNQLIQKGRQIRVTYDRVK